MCLRVQGDGLRSQLSDPAPLPAHNPASAFLPKIYGREQEKARLQRMSGTEPTHIALFTGPPNSGKTALLKDYCEERQYQGVCYMDCLQTDCTTSKGES
jgi:Cdc6-like AAA superfamily ATPase